ncbi:unnamed protein product, partial [Rotaria sordida]
MILSPSGRTTSTTNSQTSSISIMTLFKPVNQQSLTDLSPFFFIEQDYNVQYGHSPVPATPDIYPNCHENLFQCHKCRSINNDEHHPFLCNSSSYWKY